MDILDKLKEFLEHEKYMARNNSDVEREKGNINVACSLSGCALAFSVVLEEIEHLEKESKE